MPVKLSTTTQTRLPMSYRTMAWQMRKKRVWVTLNLLCQNTIYQLSEEECKRRTRTCIFPRNVIPAFSKLMICIVTSHWIIIFPLTCLLPRCQCYRHQPQSHLSFLTGLGEVCISCGLLVGIRTYSWSEKNIWFNCSLKNQNRKQHSSL